MSSLKYVKTSPEIFSDAFVWGLITEHKLLWCYICHPPQAELHGIWRYNVDQIAHTLKISRDCVLQGMEVLETADRVYTTETHIWVKRFFRYQGLSREGGAKVIHSVFQLEPEIPEIVAMWMKFYKVKSWAKLHNSQLVDDPPEVQALIDPAYAGYPIPNYKDGE